MLSEISIARARAVVGLVVDVLGFEAVDREIEKFAVVRDADFGARRSPPLPPCQSEEQNPAARRKTRSAVSQIGSSSFPSRCGGAPATAAGGQLFSRRRVARFVEPLLDRARTGARDRFREVAAAKERIAWPDWRSRVGVGRSLRQNARPVRHRARAGPFSDSRRAGRRGGGGRRARDCSPAGTMRRWRLTMPRLVELCSRSVARRAPVLLMRASPWSDSRRDACLWRIATTDGGTISPLA